MAYVRYEFLINKEGYIPFGVPDIGRTTVTSLLPQENIDIPYTVEDGTLYFDEDFYDYLAVCHQIQPQLNGTFINSYIGNNIKLSYRLNAVVVDGGYVNISNVGDIDVSPGIASNNRRLVQFCGLHWSLSDNIVSLPKDRGFSFAVFLIMSDDHPNDLTMQPMTIKTDLIVTQVGDYRTLYNVIASTYGVDYKSVRYIELVRGQLISQSPSTPYIECRFDSRVRQPTTCNYPLPSNIG
jgi:hypothetical protein